MYALLIEDHDDLAINICEYLEEQGFTMDVAGDGVTGLHLATVHEPAGPGFRICLSSRIIQPVTNLARRVEALDAQQLLELPPVTYGTDEVADLARAFERYNHRLGRFVQREKDFAADASHELRTGVASITSGVELLMTEAHGEPTRARLQRLQRASRHMSRLIEALLVLARGCVESGMLHALSAHGCCPRSRPYAGPSAGERRHRAGGRFVDRGRQPDR